ncbi:MAG: DUF2214 family protein [Bdellovibrio sp.]
MTTLFVGFHYLCFALAFGALSVQSVFLRSPQDFAKTRVLLLSRIDAVYGVAAVGSVLTGLMRVFVLGKGASYYGTHTLFWIKIGVFACIGLLSVYPTIQFIQNRSLGLQDWALNRPKVISRLRWMVSGEMVLYVILPFLAVQMAQGPHF